MSQGRRIRFRRSQSTPSVPPRDDVAADQVTLRKAQAARPAWWATSAVPYRYFWLLPSAGVLIGLAAASLLSVPVWLGFICAEMPALALEAWWRRARPSSRDPA
jgi:hypothetical protein